MLVQFDGLIPEWDVVNEPWSNHDVMDIFGDEIVVDWFQRVRDFDPGIQLTLNDYGIFGNNGSNQAHRQNFEYWLGLLNDANLLDVIGEQSHYNDASLTDIDVFGQLVQDYEMQFDTPIAITEFDVDTHDTQLQADYLRDYLTMAFSQPGISQFLHWGFWERSHWLPDASLYRFDFSAKPNGQAYEDLVFGRWWTESQNTTRAGQITADAFLGEHQVVVDFQGQSYFSSVSVDHTGVLTLQITLPVAVTNYDPVLQIDNALVEGPVTDLLTNSGRWFEPDHEPLTINASQGEVIVNDDGSWIWSYQPAQAELEQVVQITATDESGNQAIATFELDVFAVVGHAGISYGGSVWSDEAIAPDILPLFPGELATEANFTNYHRGLNRILIDFVGHGKSNLTTSDFEFRVGNNSDPSTWLELNSSTNIPLPQILVSSNDAQRIKLSWPNRAIINQWVQVTIKSTTATRLESPYVFYFGNQIADVNGDTNLENRVRVNVFDQGTVQRRRTNSAPIDYRYDITRDGRVNVADMGQIRGNNTTGGLLLFIPPDDEPSEGRHAPSILPSDTKPELKTHSWEMANRHLTPVQWFNQGTPLELARKLTATRAPISPQLSSHIVWNDKRVETLYEKRWDATSKISVGQLDAWFADKPNLAELDAKP